jgi:hypothetical protein
MQQKGDGTMNRKLKLGLVAGVLGAALVLPAQASAHNAAHHYVGNGKCVEVGAGNEVLLPASSNTPHKNADGKLDLIPGSGDQFGARFAVTRGNTPLLAAHNCP